MKFSVALALLLRSYGNATKADVAMRIFRYRTIMFCHMQSTAKYGQQKEIFLREHLFRLGALRILTMILEDHGGKAMTARPRVAPKSSGSLFLCPLAE